MALSKLGDVIFSVNTGEKVNLSNKITDKPVEDGTNISDNVSPNPLKMSFSGIVVGDDAQDKLNLLRKYSNEGSILRYIARNDINNVVIESLSTTHDNKIRNGFKFDITLKKIRIAKQKTVNIDLSKIKIPNIKELSKKAKKTRTNKKNKKGKKQKVIKEADPKRFDELQAKINSSINTTKLK